MADFHLVTERLVLRSWRETDVVPILAMRQDPRVMATLGALQSRSDVEASYDRQARYQNLLGHCSWIIELRATGEVIGTAGLQPIAPGTPIGDAIEIGWKLKFAAWGNGFAREAALACFAWGFDNLETESIWAITVTHNSRSWGLMERLGMCRRADLDFAHPALADDDPLRPHITYQMERSAWLNR